MGNHIGVPTTADLEAMMATTNCESTSFHPTPQPHRLQTCSQLFFPTTQSRTWSCGGSLASSTCSRRRLSRARTHSRRPRCPHPAPTTAARTSASSSSASHSSSTPARARRTASPFVATFAHTLAVTRSHTLPSAQHRSSWRRWPSSLPRATARASSAVCKHTSHIITPRVCMPHS